MLQNVKIINKLFIVQTILEKAGNKKIFQDMDLTVSLYSLLKIISLGANTISEMKKYSSETPASLTQKTKKLEKIGLIKGSIDKLDKRKRNFVFTNSGKNILKKVDKKIEIVSLELFKNYSDNERKIFIKILKDVELFFVKKIKQK